MSYEGEDARTGPGPGEVRTPLYERTGAGRGPWDMWPSLEEIDAVNRNDAEAFDALLTGRLPATGDGAGGSNERHTEGDGPPVGPWLLGIGEHSVDGHGVGAILADARDTTEAWCSQVELSRSRARTQRLLHSLTDGIVISDMDGHVVFANDAMCAMLGTTQEGLADALRHFTDGPDAALHAERLMARRRGESERYDWSITRPDGRTVWMRIHSNPVIRGGGAAYIVTVISDITTERLQAIELERARQEALEAVAGAEQLVARMTHELRNPLGAVLGFARLIEQGFDVEDNARQIIEAAKYLELLIADVADFNEASRGLGGIEHRPVDLTGAINKACDLSGVDGRVKLDLVTSGHSLAAIGDERRIVQVLVNLLHNAAKYGSLDAPIVVDVHHAGERVTVAVTNQGPTIPLDEQGEIFMPFHRLRRDREVAGTGVGLALCAMLVEAMGGTIAVRSTEGTTTFSFELAAPEPGRERERRVLVIEDDVHTARLWAAVARRHGLAATVVDSMDDAMREVGESVFEFMLVDVELHLERSLGRLAELVSACDPAALRHVIAVSADGDNRDEALAAGAGMFLTKPLDIRELDAVFSRDSEEAVAFGGV